MNECAYWRRIGTLTRLLPFRIDAPFGNNVQRPEASRKIANTAGTVAERADECCTMQSHSETRRMVSWQHRSTRGIREQLDLCRGACSPSAAELFVLSVCWGPWGSREASGVCTHIDFLDKMLKCNNFLFVKRVILHFQFRIPTGRKGFATEVVHFPKNENKLILEVGTTQTATDLSSTTIATRETKIVPLGKS